MRGIHLLIRNVRLLEVFSIHSNPDNTTYDNMTPRLYNAFPVEQTFIVDLPRYYNYIACNTTLFRFFLSCNGGNQCVHVVGFIIGFALKSWST